MTTWALIFLLSIITFINRYIFFSKNIKFKPSEKLKTFLSFASQAILTALWAPIVFKINQNGVISYTDLNYLISTIFVFILGFYRLNMLLVVLIGLAIFFLLKFNL